MIEQATYGEPPMDIEQAKNDPTSIFNTPQDVLQNNELSIDDKIFILHQWEYDELEKSKADEENMPDLRSEKPNLLRQIHLCLEQLQHHSKDNNET